MEGAMAGGMEPVLEGLFAGAPVGLAFWDTELRYRNVNPHLAEINGVAAEEHIGRTPLEVLGPLGERAEAVLGGVLRTRRAVVEVDMSGETPAAPGRRRHWLASFYPILNGGGAPLGVGGVVIEVTDRREAAEREQAALREAETARGRAEALARASTALASSMRPERVLAELVRAVVPTLADFCSVHLARGGSAPGLIAAAHADPSREALARELAQCHAADPAAARGAAAVIRTGVAETYPEITAEGVERAVADERERWLMGELDVRSAAVLPLAARGAVLGAITLVMGPSGRRYDPELLDLASSLAAGAGLALDNARLFAEQTEVARTLQQTLLPSELPDVPGAELAARYRAAGRSNQVGGDFYDVFAAGEAEWAFVVGDVVGKGAEAAAITSLVRATLQAATLRGDGPEAALRLVDEALRRRPRALQFCSAVHGRLRPVPEGGLDVRLLVAGHPPPLVLRANGALETVETAGTLLGVTPAPAFGDTRLRLEPGDLLLLYTDGATELPGADPWRGEHALRETLLASAGIPLPELVERVEHEVLVSSGGELRDDLVLLAVRAAPQGGQ